MNRNDAETKIIHRCECGLEYETREGLDAHREMVRRFERAMSVVRPGAYRCPACGAEYEMLDDFRAHLWAMPECARAVARDLLAHDMAAEFLELYRAPEPECGMSHSGLNEFGDRLGAPEVAQGVLLLAAVIGIGALAAGRLLGWWA